LATNFQFLIANFFEGLKIQIIVFVVKISEILVVVLNINLKKEVPNLL